MERIKKKKKTKSVNVPQIICQEGLGIDVDTWDKMSDWAKWQVVSKWLDEPEEIKQ